jgi:hypothetical protein
MTKRSLAAALIGAAAFCAAAWAVATPPGMPATFTDVTDPATRHVTTLSPEPDGSTRTVTTVDGNFNGAMTGPFHTTILRVAHPTGIADTSGVDWCDPCKDLNGNTGGIGNHLIGATGAPTNTDLGNGTGGLLSDRGTFTLTRPAGQPLTDVGFLNLAPPCLTGHVKGHLVVASGQSVCLAPGTKVSGGIAVAPGGELFARGAEINGGVDAANPAAISICGTTITGGLSVSNAQDPVLLGEPASGDCPGNDIKGSVTLTSNGNGTDFSGNTVSEDVTATGNTGGFMFGDFAPNEIKGTVVVSGNV